MRRTIAAAATGAVILLEGSLLAQEGVDQTKRPVTNPQSMNPAARGTTLPSPGGRTVGAVGMPLQPNDLGYSAEEPDNRPAIPDARPARKVKRN